MFQYQDQSLRPLTTAHLAQTMSLLVLSNPELRERVITELSSNPALELTDEVRCPSCQRNLKGARTCPACTKAKNDGDPIVFLSPREPSRRATKRTFEDTLSSLPEPAAPEDLTVHVLQQLAAELAPEDRPLAMYIMSSLDEEGFLNDPIPYIAQATRTSLSRVQHVVELISRVDPIGLATGGPKEALLTQLDSLESPVIDKDLAKAIISSTFEELARKEYEKIGKILDEDVDHVREAAAFIQDNLNPFPARMFWGSGRQPQQGDPNVYHTPDIMIRKSNDSDGQLIVEIFSAISGFLRVNPMFKKVCEEAEGEQAEEWSQHLERANLFVKCIQQRNNTMQQLMELLVTSQQRFILDGARHLEPMTRAQVAESIGVHESTVSRAVAHKSVALPDGRIIPLAKFFDRSLSVRDRIKEIVENEANPLTDDQIAEALREEGVEVARRTVAKYRAIEGILPARLRGQAKAGHMARA